MRDSTDHHDDVIEVLTEFIRGAVPQRADQSDHQVWMHPVTGSIPDLPPEPTPDVQAALTALAHRPVRPERQDIDLSGLHLTKAKLHDANLAGVNFTGADLAGANLIGANLTRAWLSDANLTGAYLGVANLTRAWLPDANLTGAHINRANLTRATLWRANLAGVNFTLANLTRADLTGANLTRAQFTLANLTRADLTGAKLGANPPKVPPGWTVTDPKTGKLRRATVQDNLADQTNTLVRSDPTPPSTSSVSFLRPASASCPTSHPPESVSTSRHRDPARWHGAFGHCHLVGSLNPCPVRAKLRWPHL